MITWAIILHSNIYTTTFKHFLCFLKTVIISKPFIFTICISMAKIRYLFSFYTVWYICHYYPCAIMDPLFKFHFRHVIKTGILQMLLWHTHDQMLSDSKPYFASISIHFLQWSDAHDLMIFEPSIKWNSPVMLLYGISTLWRCWNSANAVISTRLNPYTKYKQQHKNLIITNIMLHKSDAVAEG